MAEDNVGNWGKKLKKEWAALVQVSVWLLGLIGGFMLPPPVGMTKDDSDPWKKLAAFILTVTVGLLFFGSRKWKAARFKGKWILASIVLLGLAAGAFIEYQWLLGTRTCLYESQKLVIGTQYTPQGLHYSQLHPGISCGDILEDFAGKTEDIWMAASINHSRILLGTTYIYTLPLFAMCLVALLQALSIARGR